MDVKYILKVGHIFKLTRGMVQPITHNLVHRKQDGNDHTMWYIKAISVGPHGMVQPIAVAMTSLLSIYMTEWQLSNYQQDTPRLNKQNTSNSRGPALYFFLTLWGGGGV